MMTTSWNTIFFNNTLGAWVIAIGGFLLALLAISIIRSIVIARLKNLSLRTSTNLDDFLISIIESSGVPALYVLAFYLAANSLVLPAGVNRVLHVAFLLAFTYFIMKAITAVVKHFILSFVRRQDDSEVKVKQSKGIIIIINVVLWAVGIVFLIDNLGYNVTTLITGLGIGGIAIALAAQAVLGDLFSYFVIFFDRPFEIGDFIIIDDKMGVVEYVGIKTTRLRTLNGEQLICSNTYLTNAQVHNYKRMEERRVVFKIGVVYQTTKAQLKAIPGIVKKIIEERELTRFDRAHFSGFNDSSLDFEFVYYVLSADYNTYMDIQQEICLEIVGAFEEQQIDFAFPTRTIMLNYEDIKSTENLEHA